MDIFPASIPVAIDGARIAEPAVIAAELSKKIGSEMHFVYGGEEITETRPPRSCGSDEEVGEEARRLLDEKSREIEASGGSVGGV